MESISIGNIRDMKGIRRNPVLKGKLSLGSITYVSIMPKNILNPFFNFPDEANLPLSFDLTWNLFLVSWLVKKNLSSYFFTKKHFSIKFALVKPILKLGNFWIHILFFQKYDCEKLL